jgi:cell wall-associated NlpC family hydrolase
MLPLRNPRGARDETKHARRDLGGVLVISSRHGVLLAAAAVTLPCAMALGITLTAVAADGTGLADPAQPVTSACNADSAQGIAAAASLSAAQTGDALIIYDVSVSMDLPQQAAVIALATAYQESRLYNLSYGTGDSLGLFQQRPSQGWGTPAQIVQPVYAATAFYTALIQVPGWQNLPLTVAAQDVQHSAYPDAYAQWAPLATALVATFTGTATNCLTDNSRGIPASGVTQLPSWFTLLPTTPRAVVTAISYAVAQLGKPYIWGGTGPDGYDCSGLVMMAYQAAGISLPRTTFQQVYAGTPVYSTAQLQPGDLIFTPGSDGTPTDPGHVGMYIGSGLVISAPETGKPITLTPLNGYWSQQATAIRRVAS